jgi:hypothetical protein
MLAGQLDQTAVQVDSPDYGLKGVGQDGRLVPPTRFFLVFTEFEVAAEMQPTCDIGKHVHVHHGSALPGQQGLREIGVRSERGVGPPGLSSQRPVLASDERRTRDGCVVDLLVDVDPNGVVFDLARVNRRRAAGKRTDGRAGGQVVA